jgi:hypothetical protein
LVSREAEDGAKHVCECGIEIRVVEIAPTREGTMAYTHNLLVPYSCRRLMLGNIVAKIGLASIFVWRSSNIFVMLALKCIGGMSFFLEGQVGNGRGC